jgi:hypothetical protein
VRNGVRHDVSTEDAGVRFLGYSLWGVRAATCRRVTPSTTAFVTGGFEARNHDEDDPTFLQTRRDRQYDLTLGASYAINHTLSLTPSVHVIDSRSNLDVYAYRRVVSAVTLRQGF